MLNPTLGVSLIFSAFVLGHSQGLLTASSLDSHPHSKTIPTSGFSSDSEDSPSPSSSSSLSEQRRRRQFAEGDDVETDRKRRRCNHGRREIVEVLENRDGEKDKEEEEDSRFVGRMVVSFRRGGGGGGEGAEEGDAAITLHNFSQKKYKECKDEGPTDQSGKSVVAFRRNGFRAPLALQRWVLFFRLFHLFEVCC